MLRTLSTTLLLIMLAGFASGCGQSSEHASDTGQVPAGVQPANANKLPQQIQSLQITVSGGKFDSDKYTMQSGAVQLAITTVGGPYTFMIEKLVQPQQLAANSKTKIGVNVPVQGTFRMKITSGGDGAATLDVRAPGGK